MGRDKKKDDEFFNCSQDHEIIYVARLYPGNEKKVREFLEAKCKEGLIKYFTHQQVYELIKKQLGYAIPN